MQPARLNLQPTHIPPNEPSMNKNAKFGLFWAKNPFFTGEIKSFVTHITENLNFFNDKRTLLTERDQKS